MTSTLADVISNFVSSGNVLTFVSFAAPCVAHCMELYKEISGKGRQKYPSGAVVGGFPALINSPQVLYNHVSVN